MLAMVAFAGLQQEARAQTTINLGTAGNFAVLAGASIVNTGDTTIVGDVGVSPGASVTGFPPGVVNGTIYASGNIAANAETDLSAE